MKEFFVLLVCLSLSSGLAWADAQEQEMSIWNLDEIVVTATKTPHLLKDVPVETVVITKEEIENSSAQTVSDLLRYIPGVFIRSEDAPGISSWRATIRGLSFNHGYGLVLEDGQRVKGNGMGDYGIGLNQIPPQMIERIEIVKGPSSVLYGSDALAGVVNIITKPAPDKTIYGFEADYGTHETNMQYLYWGTKLNSLGIIFQAAREDSDMGEYGIRNNRAESYKRTGLAAKFSYELSKNLTLGLKLSVQEENRKRTYLTQDTTVLKDYHKYRIAPQIKATFDDKSVLTVQGYYYDWDFDGDSYGSDPYPYTLYRGDMYYKDIEARYTKLLGTNHLLTVGSEYLQEKLDYTMAHKTLHLTSGYIQDETEFSIGIPIDAVIGGRIDHHSQYGTEFCPKISLMLQVGDQTKVRASVGRGFKSPTIRQAYYTEPFKHGSYWYKSNPDLEAETAWGYSLGIEQNFGEKFLGNVTLFRNDVKNKIVRVDTDEIIDGKPVKSYENVEKAYTQGVEVGLKLAIIKDILWLDVGYTYLDTENRETKKDLTYTPHHNLAGHVVFDYNRLGITLDIGAQYVSKMYTNTSNTSQTKDYSVVDVKLIKKITKNASISIEGNNIFESDYGEPDRDWWGATWLVRFKMDF